MTTTRTKTIDTICQLLGEHDRQPRQQIAALVGNMGERWVGHIALRAVELERGSGLLTQDGTRRRTPGGTFFFLVRGQLYQERRWRVMATVFPRPKRQAAKRGRYAVSVPAQQSPAAKLVAAAVRHQPKERGNGH
jgi:hypothetical protein